MMRMAGLIAVAAMALASLSACSTPLLGEEGMLRMYALELIQGVRPGLDWFNNLVGKEADLDVSVLSPPVVSITKSLLSGNPAQRGDVVEFLIVVRNIGISDIAALRLTDIFDPAYLTFTEASITPDGLEGGVVLWESILGEEGLTPGEKVSLFVSFSMTGQPETSRSATTLNMVSVVATDREGGTSLEYTDGERLEVINPFFVEPEVEENEAPQAVIIGPTDGFAGQELQFRGDESSDDQGSIVSYSWSFGDGATSEAINPAHIFEKPGTYEVILRVEDGAGLADEAVQRVEIGEEANSPPEAIIVGALEGYTGQKASFRGDESYDADGTIVFYKWFFGDGGIAYGYYVDHIYETAGTYTVKLYVKDDDGLSDTAIVRVTIRESDNAPPVAVIIAPEEAAKGTWVLFRGGESYDDHNDIVLYRWNFGDGTTADGKNVEHRFMEAGTYEVTLQVKDGGGLVGETSRLICICVGENLPPVAVIIGPGEWAVGQTISFRGDESYDDHDSIICYEWDFGDGSVKSYVMNPTHIFAEAGSYTVKLRVKDDAYQWSPIVEHVIEIYVPQ
jgi:uncharacterized repeat protein (TIGR01451 family)